MGKLKKIREIKPKAKRGKLVTIALSSFALLAVAAVVLTNAFKANMQINKNALTEIAKDDSIENIDTSVNFATVFSNESSNPSQDIEKVQTASGNTFVAYLRSDGTVWTWGNNQYGQLGNGKIENVNEFEISQVVGENGIGHLENIKQITAGAYFMGALTNDRKSAYLGL